MQAGILALRNANSRAMGSRRPRLPRYAAGVAAMSCLWTGAVAAAADEAVHVSVTTKPVHSLVAQVMDGVALPQLIVDGSSSAHTFALKPSSIRAITSGGVFVRVSEATEPFTHKLVEGLPKDVEVLTLADEKLGLKLMPQRHGGSFEPHVHDEDAAHGNEHDDEGLGGGIDGHVWLDPENAKAIVRAVARTLSQRWPEHATAFASNGANAIARLDALSADVAREVAPLQGKPFIVFHDAYQYFESRFGLAALGAITLSPDRPPSAMRLTEVRGKIVDLGAKCVFSEPGFQPKLLAAVVEGTTAHTASLDPEGQALQAGPELYAKLMRGLAKGLKECLTIDVSK